FPLAAVIPQLSRPLVGGEASHCRRESSRGARRTNASASAAGGRAAKFTLRPQRRSARHGEGPRVIIARRAMLRRGFKAPSRVPELLQRTELDSAVRGSPYGLARDYYHEGKVVHCAPRWM